jgi:predicted dehydrogenase
MPSSRLRGALVGCGAISDYHLRGWGRIPEVEIVALCDARPEAARGRAQALAPGARIYDALEAMLEAERLDFVDVVTPPALHAAHVRRAMAARVHVICQKPLCPDPDEARRLVAELRGYDRLAMVHENHRFRPWCRALAARIASGALGRPRFLRLEQLDPYEPKEAFKAAGARAVLLEYGVHLVDVMRALLGDPVRVFARTQRPNPRVRGDSLAHVVFDYPDATAVIDVAWKAGGAQQGGALLVGDRGEAFYEGRMTHGEAARFRVLEGTEVVVDEARRPTDDYVESFYLLERAMTDAMLGRGAPPQPAEDNLRTLLCTFAAYEAAETGRVVEIGAG